MITTQHAGQNVLQIVRERRSTIIYFNNDEICVADPNPEFEIKIERVFNDSKGDRNAVMHIINS